MVLDQFVACVMEEEVKNMALSKENREWADKWKVSPEILERYRQELIQAKINGSYRVHADIEQMDEAEVKFAYMNMRNYLSDARTHD